MASRDTWTGIICYGLGLGLELALVSVVDKTQYCNVRHLRGVLGHHCVFGVLHCQVLCFFNHANSP